jgi:RNA polymerase sigma-54 factor
MRIDAGQFLRMEQRLKLSPRMIQSMEILQLPLLLLESRIEQELEENPVLELTERDDAGSDLGALDGSLTSRIEAADASPETYAPGEDDRPLAMADSERERHEAADDFRRADDMSEQLGDDWTQNTLESADYHTPARRDDGERDAKIDAMANTAARTASLSEQLLDQWRYIEMAPEIRRAGEHLMEFIDDEGYLRTPLEQVAQQAPPGVTLAQITDALMLLQRQVDPPGIGARSLQESLTLQIDAMLKDAGPDDELHHARTIITQHLMDLEMNRLPRIARDTGLSIDQIKSALLRMRRLDPRPGRRLAPERKQVIIPDVIVEYDPYADRYVAALNTGRTPALRINPAYQAMAGDRDSDKQTRQYLARNVNNARWLIDAIAQRNSTLLRVVNVVLDAQREFFDHGPEFLKPLPMILVADQLGIHVGTVSRAVAEKYMQTPRGIYPLRMFFSGGTENAEGQEMSWAAVQAKLKAVIDAEDKADPLSDDALVERLKEQGIEIARRTVAKYRQQMNIPPARRRREF